MTKEKHLIVVDGMALLFRSYFATAAFGNFFPNQDGVPTNGVQGFLRHYLTAVDLFQPTHSAICWDMGAETFRNDIYEGYKANRPKPDDELVPQFDMARDASKLLEVCTLGEKGVEADDVIGALSRQFAPTHRVTIISGDKDLFQLLRPNVRLALTKKGYSEYDIYDEARFIDEFGFRPSQYAHYKAFVGDQADGYPGVKGIGPKTAKRLIQKYKTIDGVLGAIDEHTPGIQKKLLAQREEVPIFYQLAKIPDDYTVDVTEEELVLPKWNDRMTGDMEALGYSLVLRHYASLQRK